MEREEAGLKEKRYGKEGLGFGTKGKGKRV
jgi:hypothetical protein